MGNAVPKSTPNSPGSSQFRRSMGNLQ
jgi:hypothetical protein